MRDDRESGMSRRGLIVKGLAAGASVVAASVSYSALRALAVPAAQAFAWRRAR